MTVALTGASGQLGRLIAEGLIDSLPPQDVVLVTRTPATLADLAARGAEVRPGDFDDPASLSGAFAGVDRLLVISGHTFGTRVAQHTRAIRAAVDAGVHHIVYTSMGNPADDNPAIAAADHRATETALRASGVAWTILRNGIYADLQVGAAAGAIATGTLLTNVGNGRNAFVTRADLAAATVAVLTTEGHESKTYDLTGPEPLDADDLAAIFSEVGETTVEVVHMDDQGWVDAMVEHAGVPIDLANVLATFGAAQRQGYSAVVTPTIERLTGRPPTSMRQFLSTQSEALVAA